MEQARSTAQQKTLDSLTNKLDQLPLLPGVVTRLMALDTTQETVFEEVLKLAQEDPSFSVRIIQLANSARNAPVNAVTTLNHAIARLGARQITSLVTSLAVLKVFVPTTDGQKNLWLHAVETAVAAKTIAKLNTTLDVDPEEAYLCGLMHDIGRFIMFEDIPEELGKVDETHWESPMQLVEAELSICGFDHAELGGLACEKWKLPEQVSKLVKNHHVYQPAALNCQDKKCMNTIQVVQMADFFSVLLLLNPDFLSLPPLHQLELIKDQCIHAKWSESPVSPETLLEHAEEIMENTLHITRNLGINIQR